MHTDSEDGNLNSDNEHQNIPLSDRFRGMSTFLNPLAREFTKLLHLTSNEEKEALTTIISRGLTEPLGQTHLLKTNAIAYALRSLQLDKFLPGQETELFKFFENALVGLIDAGNIKEINENSAIGGSYAAGDAAIQLHIESINGAALEMGMIPIILRPLGDEFLPLLLTSKPVDLAKFKQKVQVYTNEALDKIASDDNDPAHPLKQIVLHNRQLINKTMSIGLLRDVKVPDKTMRMADLSEIILAQAEEAENTPDHDNVSVYKKYFKNFVNQPTFPKHIIDTSYAKDVSAVKLILADIKETTSVSEEENSPEIISNRWQIVSKYCPDSIRQAVDILHRKSANSLTDQALTLTLIEEAIFNMQFQRDPPVLNRWAYQELLSTTRDSAGNYKYQESGMVSTFFLKTINMVDGRLGGNSVINSLITEIRESANHGIDQSDILLCKEGGSISFAATSQAADRLTSNLNVKADQIIFGLQDYLHNNPADSPESIAKVIKFWTQIPTFSRFKIADSADIIRTPANIGRIFDYIRNHHYQAESNQADYLKTEMNRSIRGHSNLVATILMTLFLERPSRRINDWQELWTDSIRPKRRQVRWST